MRPSAGFTLLELVVVLAILAVVTAMATRVISHVEDQQRYESSQHELDELQAAVLGSPDDRTADGTRTVSGFVADLGRLPRTILNPNVDGHGTSGLTLQELWMPSGLALFDVRSAIEANGVPAGDRDEQVRVPGGWHGPYLQLPSGPQNFLDGWGNPYISPAIPPDPETALSTGYARLRDASDGAITTPGQEVIIVRHLGANGAFEPTDAGYDRDEAIAFSAARYVVTSIKGNVEVLSGNDPATPDSNDTVTVKVFGPDPSDPSKILVFKKDVPFATNPVNYELTATTSPLTVGPRVVRAYYQKNGESDDSRASAVKTATLRAGVNQLDLTVDRAFTRLPATP